MKRSVARRPERYGMEGGILNEDPDELPRREIKL